MEAEREEFESWARSERLPVERVGNGYTWHDVQLRWEGYQAGRAAQAAAVKVPDLDPIDLRIDSFPRWPEGTMRAGLPVGVEIRHKPSGMCVIVDNHRSQHRNRDEALRQLAFLVHFAGAAAAANTPGDKHE